MTEKFTEYYISSHYNIPKDEVVLSREGEIEDKYKEEMNEYNNFMDIYSQKDLTKKIFLMK